MAGRSVHGLPRPTPSLRLRHFRRDDALAIMALNAQPSTSRWLTSHVYASADEARRRMKYLISCYAEPGDPRLGPYVLAVEHREGGRLLGHVGFSPLDGEVEISYAIAESDRGRGYATEAITQACNWIAGTFAVPRVLAVTAADNLPSCRTLLRAGFAHVEDQDRLFQRVRQAVSLFIRHAPLRLPDG